MSSFTDLRVVDNFYQTSLFFPMPTVIVSTVADDGTTSCGPYSLVQPYYVAGKDYYAMLLNCRNSSNTAQHLLKRGTCALNFIPDDRTYFKECVRLGWPGDTPQEKMKDCLFTLEDGLAAASDPVGAAPRPQVVTESFQVIECTWMRELDGADRDLPGELNGYEPPYHDFNGIISKFGAAFILRVDKILMKEQYANAIINGVTAKDFPPVPVDYGYRDSKNFWYTKFPGLKNLRGAIPELLPIRKTTLDSVRYAADRIDPDVHFTDDALETIRNVPRVFLPTVLKGCVAWAKENGVDTITAAEMAVINDKRAKEKARK